MNQRLFAVVAAISAVFIVVVFATGVVPGAADDLSFDHISFGVGDPARAAAWYAQNLGATPEGASGVAFGSIHLRFREATTTARPSAGSVVDHLGQVPRDPGGSVGDVIDHLAWTTANVDAAAAVLKRNGVKFMTEPRTTGNLQMAFVEGPNQLRVEILQR